MAQSRRTFSLFLSIALWLTALQCHADDSATRRTAFDITLGNGGHLSGILLTRHTDGGEIAGTMINEFGVTALSFIYRVDKEKMELRDVIGFLNKWYIKRVLRSDLADCLRRIYDLPAKRRRSHPVTTEGDTVTITNHRHHITYSFSPLTGPELTDEATR